MFGIIIGQFFIIFSMVLSFISGNLLAQQNALSPSTLIFSITAMIIGICVIVNGAREGK